MDGGEPVPGVDHIHSMLEGNADDVVLSEVGTDGRETFSDLVCFIGLQGRTRVRTGTRRRCNVPTF